MGSGRLEVSSWGLQIGISGWNGGFHGFQQRPVLKGAISVDIEKSHQTRKMEPFGLELWFLVGSVDVRLENEGKFLVQSKKVANQSSKMKPFGLKLGFRRV